MILDLREFETFPARALLQSRPGELEIEFNGLMAVKNAGLELKIQKSGEEYFCQGVVTALATLECSRCLEDFDTVLTGSTDFIVCAEGCHNKDGDVIDDEDYAYFKGADLRADLTELARQAIILAVGMKPLCSEECRGICSQCGVNLNDETCNCINKIDDERREDLKNLSGQ